AEDGIRDFHVTGVQTCALPISALAQLGDQLQITGNRFGAITRDISYRFSPAISVVLGWVNLLIDGFFDLSEEQRQQIVRWTAYRSEERRVGNEWRCCRLEDGAE